jgi:prepilin-type N-terminal cleavage/methylation domain-containing protein
MPRQTKQNNNRFADEDNATDILLNYKSPKLLENNKGRVMFMYIRRRKFFSGVTLIEMMVAMAIMIFASIGALSYQFYAARDAGIASAQMSAARIAMLLLEDWKSTGGSKDYDPNALKLGFTSALPVPAHFSQGVGGGLGSPLHDSVHAIMIDDVALMIMLSWYDVTTDATSGVILRQLSAMVTFDSAWEGHSQKKLENLNPIILTTYVRADEAGG